MPRQEEQDGRQPQHLHTCNCCHQPYNSLSQHFRRHPECWDCDDECPPAPAGVSATCKLFNGCDIEQQHINNEWRAHVAEMLAEFRYDHFASEAMIQRVKDFTRRVVHELDNMLAVELKPLLKENLDTKQVRDFLARRHHDIFDGVSTCAQEMAYYKQMVPYLPHREVDVAGGGSPDDTVYSFDVCSLLQRALQNDSTLRAHVLQKSNEWKKGDNFRQHATVFQDIDDGEVARFHPHLMEPAPPEQEFEVRIGLGLYLDDVEVHTHLSPLSAPRPCCALEQPSVILCATASECNWSSKGQAQVVWHPDGHPQSSPPTPLQQGHVATPCFVQVEICKDTWPCQGNLCCGQAGSQTRGTMHRRGFEEVGARHTHGPARRAPNSEDLPRKSLCSGAVW